jgi:hypothetical protein
MWIFRRNLNMSDKYDFEVRLTRKEYSALTDIRGLDDGPHSMRMCAEHHENGDATIQGSHDDFDALLRNLDEEIEEGFAPKKNPPALRRIREYITPQEGDDDAPYTASPE